MLKRGSLITLALFALLAAAALFARPASAAIGELDGSFGAGGKVTTDFAERSGANAVLVLPDGKIVAGGFVGGNFALARYNANGTLDTSFDGDGKVATSFTGNGDVVFALARQSDGKIIAAGHSGELQFAVARYNTNGSLDTGFGSSGKIITTFGSSAAAQAVAVTPDGKIVAVGYAEDNGYKIAIARYLSNGALDSGFGSGGRLTSIFASGASAQAMLLLGDGKLVVAGGAANDFLVARFTPEGTLDSTFRNAEGGAGWARIDFGSRVASARALALQPDGKIVVGGGVYINNANRSDLAMARLNADGSNDTSFANGGKLTADIRGTDIINSLAIGRYGRILVGGVTGFDVNRNFLLVRYNANGQLDPTFSVPAPGPGRITTDFDEAFDQGNAVAIQSNGSIVTAGQTAGQLYSHFALTRHQSPLFNDVRTSDYFYDPVVYLSERGIISGYDDGTFRPFNNATRGQIAKIVVLAEGFPLLSPATPTFRDVATTNPFYREIETAVSRGIISGYDVEGGREFRPNNNVTRGQLSKIIVIAEGWTLLSPATPTFRDVATTNPFYREIETAFSRGIISGYDVPGGREFRWANNATRGQISKIVYEAVTGPANDKPADEPVAQPTDEPKK